MKRLPRLEYYSKLATRIINETEDLANSLRHKYITTSHLAIVIESFIASDRINLKMGCKNPPLIALDLVETFSKHYEDTFHIRYRIEYLSRVPERNLGASAHFDLHILTVLTFAEDKGEGKVNARAIINELLLFENNRKRSAERIARETLLRRANGSGK